LPHFKESAFEQVYQDSVQHCDVHGLSAGIVFHIVGCMWLRQVVVSPDHGSDYFNDHGNGYLKEQMKMTQQLLMANLVSSIVFGLLILTMIGSMRACATLVHGMMRKMRCLALSSCCLGLSSCKMDSFAQAVRSTDGSTEEDKPSDSAATSSLQQEDANNISPRVMRVCAFIFVLLKVQLLVMCMVVGLLWPSRRAQTVIFGLASMCNFGLSYCTFGLSFWANGLLLVLGAVATWLAAYLPYGTLQAMT